METYLNLDGVECVVWKDEQGTHSMLKSTYEAIQAEHFTPMVADK